MQLFGARRIVVVVLTHVCDALHLLPGMHWGVFEHSAGHVDLVGAVLSLIISCRILALCALPQIATTE
jgi:hypothetical protein